MHNIELIYYAIAFFSNENCIIKISPPCWGKILAPSSDKAYFFVFSSNCRRTAPNTLKESGGRALAVCKINHSLVLTWFSLNSIISIQLCHPCSCRIHIKAGSNFLSIIIQIPNKYGVVLCCTTRIMLLPCCLVGWPKPLCCLRRSTRWHQVALRNS